MSRRSVELRLRRLADGRIRATWQDTVDLDDGAEVHEVLVAAVITEAGKADSDTLPRYQLEARRNGSWRPFRAGKK